MKEKGKFCSSVTLAPVRVLSDYTGLVAAGRSARTRGIIVTADSSAGQSCRSDPLGARQASKDIPAPAAPAESRVMAALPRQVGLMEEPLS